MLKKILLGILGFWFLGFGFCFAYNSPGKPVGFVNDFAGALSASSRQNLENELVNFEKQTKHEIAVVTIKNLDGDSVENYAVKLFEEWRIGKKGADDGILFLVAVDDHKMRIEVGYGLEGALTDLQASQILDQIAKPNFRNNDFDTGISLSVAEIEKAIRGEPLSIDARTSSDIQAGEADWKGYFGLIIFFIVFGAARGIFNALGKTKSFWLGGVLGGIAGSLIGGLLVGTLAATVGAAIIFTLFGLFFDYGASRKGWFKNRNKAGAGFWGGFFLGGGGRGGFGGGSGGFGGFGGGGSGGGGSSGSW